MTKITLLQSSYVSLTWIVITLHKLGMFATNVALDALNSEDEVNNCLDLLKKNGELKNGKWRFTVPAWSFVIRCLKAPDEFFNDIDTTGWVETDTYCSCGCGARKSVKPTLPVEDQISSCGQCGHYDIKFALDGGLCVNCHDESHRQGI